MDPENKKQEQLMPDSLDPIDETEELDMQFEQVLEQHYELVRGLSRPSSVLEQRIKEVEIEQKAPNNPNKQSFLQLRWSWVGVGFALSCVGMLLWFVVYSPHENKHLVLKGCPVQIHLEYARKVQQRLVRRSIRPQEHFRAGDLFQFVYHVKEEASVKSAHLMILSIDEKGTISILAPFGGKKSIQLSQRRGTFPQGESLEISPKPSRFRFFALYSLRPFSTSQVRQTLKKSYQRSNKDLQPLYPSHTNWNVCWTHLGQTQNP